MFKEEAKEGQHKEMCDTVLGGQDGSFNKVQVCSGKQGQEHVFKVEQNPRKYVCRVGQ